MPLTNLQLTCIAGAAAAAVATAGFALYDPTSADLDRVAQAAAMAGRLSHRLKADTIRNADAGALMQQPIFIMSTGPTAYHDKALSVSGIAITRGRRAALVSVDGGALRWLQVGESANGLTLTDVRIDGATFDTPVGPRFVGLSSAPATATPPAAGADADTPAQPAPPVNHGRAPMSHPVTSNGIDF